MAARPLRPGMISGKLLMQWRICVEEWRRRKEPGRLDLVSEFLRNRILKDVQWLRRYNLGALGNIKLELYDEAPSLGLPRPGNESSVSIQDTIL